MRGGGGIVNGGCRRAYICARYKAQSWYKIYKDFINIRPIHVFRKKLLPRLTLLADETLVKVGASASVSAGSLVYGLASTSMLTGVVGTRVSA